MKLYIALILLGFTAFAPAQTAADSLGTFTVKKPDDNQAYNNAGSVVSAVKMNVLYIGVDNPIEIAVPGVAAKNITVTINNGDISKVDNYYIAHVTTPGKCLVTIKVNGKTVSRHEFRCKRVPDPVVTLNGNLRGGNVALGTLKAAVGVIVVLENFDFDLRINITGFTMTVLSNGQTYTMQATSPVFTNEMKNAIANCKPKDIIVIDNVIVAFPDSQLRKLQGPTFTII